MKSALTFALSLIATLCAAEPLPAGKAKLSIAVRDEAFDVFTYRPASFQNGPLLVVMHGLGRNADGYRDHAVPLADQFHALVVAPHFPKERFPTDSYQRGGVLRDGKAQPKEEWTFQRVADLIQLIREREGRADMPCFLIGHSAGGQILHRMAAFLPGDAQRIIAANPGTLLFPTRDQKYPLGFGGLPGELGSDAQIQRYLAAPLTLYLGTADVLKKDLDVSESAMRQGKTRFERGHACFDMAKALAQERGWPFNWQLIEAPEVGHSAKAMFSHPQALKTFTKP
jgi:poly(3-hydroxybutyrate) depolymerase